MVYVCKGMFKEKPDGFYMDPLLKLQLDVLLKNIKKDWDFTIIIGGEGEVRVGKSKLAMDIASYWTYEIEKRYGKKCPFNVEDNFVFEGEKLIKKGNYLGQNFPFSVLIFDEAGADLEGRKTMHSSTQMVLDFYRECGQYNLLNILVLPEFFDLPKGIALSRSIFLINVSYEATEAGIFERGHFKFYSKRSKKWLYLKGKRDLNYSCVKYDFRGTFSNFYQVNEQEYRKAKQEALSKRQSKSRSKFLLQRDALIYILCGEKQEKDIKQGEKIMTQEQLGIRLEQLTGLFIAQQTISDALRRLKSEQEDND